MIVKKGNVSIEKHAEMKIDKWNVKWQENHNLQLAESFNYNFFLGG